MSFRFKSFILTAFVILLSAAMPAFSQSTVQGSVTDESDKVVAGATITFDRTDAKGHTDLKTDPKGHFKGFLKPGKYSLTLTINGQDRAKVATEVVEGVNPDMNFNLKQAAEAAANGPATKAAAEKAAKDREAELAKRNALMGSFNEGKTALDNKQWDEAITQLTKAAELDPKQVAVWGGLADAYVGSAKAVKGADAGPIFDKAFDSYKKMLELDPANAGTYNNYALALAADHKLDEAKANMTKAIDLDPASAGKFHNNLGAILMNNNQNDAAVDEFKKAMDANPPYVEAYYQYGTALVGKATLDPSGKTIAPPGTVEAFQKYLALAPTGPNADSAKQLLEVLGATVSMNYKDPNAPAPKNTKKK